MLRRGVPIVLVTLAGLAAACGLSVTGVDGATSPTPTGDGGTSPAGDDEQSATGGDDDDDATPAPVALDAGGVIADAGDLFDGGGTTADASTCNPTALIVYDDGDQSSADGLMNYMASHGFTTAVEGAPVTTFHGGAGPADPNGKGVIVLLLGSKSPIEMPPDGQNAIADRVKAGAGFVTEEWMVFDVAANGLKTLAQFSLATSPEQYTYTPASSVTITFADARFWDGTGANAKLRPVKRVSYGNITVRTGITIDGTSGKDPLVFSTEEGATRIAQTALAINDHSDGALSAMDDSLATDDNVKTLFNNMALWAAHCR